MQDTKLSKIGTLPSGSCYATADNGHISERIA